MKLRVTLFTLLAATFQLVAAPFQNLDFESAMTNALVPVTPGLGTGGTSLISDLLPGWQLYRGTNLLDTMGYNYFTSPFAFTGGATLIGRDYVEGFAFEEKLSLRLAVPGGLNPDPFILVQRGDIPEGARFLAFTYRWLPFTVSINGVDLPPSINPGSPTTIFDDISQFAGQNVELSFRTSATSLSGSTGWHDLDSIAFLIPEPSTNALLSLGAVALAGGWMWRTRKIAR